MIGTKSLQGGTVNVIDILGEHGASAKLTKDQDLEKLLERIIEIYTNCSQKIFINMSQVTRVDKESVKALVNVLVEYPDIQLCFFGIQRSVRDTLVLWGFFVAFPGVYSDQRAAVASLEPPKETH